MSYPMLVAMSESKRQVFRQIERLADGYLSWLKELVAVPSPTGYEKNAQRLVENRMRDLNVFERLVYVDSNAPVPQGVSPYWPTVDNEKKEGKTEQRQPYSERACVMGLLGKEQGPKFILNAHIDTAPVENANSWSHPPFSGVTVDGRLYGRGAVDDKAGIAMMLMLAEAFRHANVTLPGSLILESVIEDEDSGNGTLACLRSGYSCDAAIVIDGTWPYRIIDAHLGQLWLNGEVRGIPVAACSQNRGRNPIDAAMATISAWRVWTAECNRAIQNWEGIANPFFVNPGMLQGGVWAGAVPETARFSVQIGFPPPWTPDSVFLELEKTALQALNSFPGVEITLHKGALGTPSFANRSNKLARLLESTIAEMRPEESVRQQLRRVAVAGHCDLRHLRRADGSPADAVLYGPGGGGNPHVRDEYYEVSHFVPVAQNIAATILRWFKI